TSTTVIGAPNPSVYGQLVTFTATLNTATATGSVSFFDGLTLLRASPVVAGTAVFTISSPTAGRHIIPTTYSGAATVTPISRLHTITASYVGNANFASSTGAISLTVLIAFTTTTLTSSANPSVLGQTVTFMATITPVPPGAGTPTGIIGFTIDANPPVAVPLP